MTRTIYPLRSNVNASLDDEVYPVHPDRKLKAELLRRGLLYCGRAVVPKELKADATVYRDMLIQHLDRRVTALFLQLLMVQGTKKRLAIGGTLAQGERVLWLPQVIDGGGVRYLMKRNACHSATIPHLVGVFPGSSCDRFQNATLAMPLFINNADSTLDAGRDGLRNRGLAILQRASDGKIEVEEGVIEFVATLESALGEHPPRAEVEGVFAVFRDQMKRIKTATAKGSPLYDRWLDLRPEETKKDRRAIHRIRMDCIRINAEAESAVMADIEKAKEALVAGKKRPDYYSEAFQYRLLKSLDDEDRPHIAKLLSDSGRDPAEVVPCTTRYATTMAWLKKHQDVFTDLAAVLHKQLVGLGEAEELARQVILVKLMKARKIDAIEGVDPIKDEALTREERDTVCRVLQVREDFFYPSWFYAKRSVPTRDGTARSSSTVASTRR